MKVTVSNVLGVGGVISMIISPVLSFGTIKTELEVVKTKVALLEDMKKVVEADHDLIIAIAAKQGIDTSKAVSILNIN